MAKNVPDLDRDMVGHPYTQSRGVSITRFNPKRIPGHMVIKLSKIKFRKNYKIIGEKRFYEKLYFNKFDDLKSS